LNEKYIWLAFIVVIIAVAAGLSAVILNQSGEISSMSQKISSLEAEKTDMVAKLTQLGEELTATKAEASNLTQMLKSRDAEISRLKGELTDAGSEIDSLKQKLSTADSEISKLKSDVASYLERIRILTIPIDQRHLNASNLTQADCLSCHINTLRLVEVNESNRYHNIHLNNRLLNFTCTDCHKQVNILALQKNLTDLVDTKLCVKCHSPFPMKEAMGQWYDADLWLLSFPDCTKSKCHDDWKSKMKDASFVNISAITKQDCFTCHGKHPLFGIEPKSIHLSCNVCH